MSKFKYYNGSTAAYSGQVNMIAVIYHEGKTIGYVEYVLYDDELTVSNIFVDPEWRRKGIGSRLMKYVKKENPEYKYQPSMKTDDGAKFIHKDVPLDEGMLDILKGKSQEESWAQLPWKVKDFWKKLKQDFPNAKFHWGKKGFRTEYGLFQIFYLRHAYYITFTKQHWAGIDMFNIWMRSPENRNDFMAAGHVRNYEEFKKELIQLDKEVYDQDTEDYGDVPADYVKEGLSDILKPKDPEVIQQHIRDKFNIEILKTEFLTYPYTDEYFKDFYFEKNLYVLDKKWENYINTHKQVERSGIRSGYQDLDITDDAKNEILKSTKNIKSKRPLRVLQFNWAAWGRFNSDSIQHFFREMNIINGVHGQDSNPKWKHFGDNRAFKWAYYGDEYSYVGNSDGLAIFIVPDDFFKRFFGINESIYNILKPKTIEEIKQSVIDLVEKLEETQNAAEFIDTMKEEEPDVAEELERVCNSMGSYAGNVEFIIEESKGFEEIQKLTNIIDEKSNSQRNSVARAEHPLTYENMSYRINPVAKLAWGYPNDFNGMNVIFFDYPNLLKSIKKVEFAWEKYQTE